MRAREAREHMQCALHTAPTPARLPMLLPVAPAGSGTGNLAGVLFLGACEAREIHRLTVYVTAPASRRLSAQAKSRIEMAQTARCHRRHVCC